MEVNTYILAPHTAQNFAVVQQAIQGFPDLIAGRQIGGAYQKNIADVLDADGGLLLPANITPYIYVKANTVELYASGLLEHVQDYTLYTIDTQPFSIYWLNVV